MTENGEREDILTREDTARVVQTVCDHIVRLTVERDGARRQRDAWMAAFRACQDYTAEVVNYQSPERCEAAFDRMRAAHETAVEAMEPTHIGRSTEP